MDPAWPVLAVVLLAIQAAFAIMVGVGSSRVPNAGILYVLSFLPLLLGAGVSALNAIRSGQAIRLFWSFFSLSCMLWAANAWYWIYYVAVLRKDHPDYLLASVPLFLQPIFLIAAVASRPHVKLLRDKPYRNASICFQLLFFGVFAYAFVVSPVLYMQWGPTLIHRGGVFYAAENFLLLAVLGAASVAVRPPWKGIYRQILGASVLYALGSLTEHVVIVSGTLFAGLDDLLYTAAACWLVWVALRGRKLAPELAESVQIDPIINPKYASTLAMLAVVAIPIVGVWELFRADRPHPPHVPRLLIVFLALLFLAVTAFITEYLTKRELSSDVDIAHDRLRMAMASSKSVGWEWDLATGRDLWFGDLQTIFGIPSDTFTGQAQDFYRYLHPDDRQRVSEAVTNARVNHKPYEVDFRVVWQDGTVRWVAAGGAFRYAKNGDPERMLSMAVDITERKQAEERLKKCEEKFSKAFRESPMVVTVTSAQDHRYLDVNQTFELITGWRRDEVIGRTPFDLGIWADPAKRMEFVKQVQTEGTVRNVEVIYRCKDGEQRVGLGSAETIEMENEPCVLSVIADIPERKQIQEQLHKSEERLRGIVNSAMDAIIAINEQQRIVLFNAAAEKMFGCAADEALGTAVDRFVPQRFRSEHEAHLHRFGESGITNRAMGRLGAVCGIRTNGEEFPIEASISHIETEGNKIFTIIVRDLTERRRAEEALRESEERYRHLVDASTDWVWEVNADGFYTYAGPQCWEILGYEPSELIGKKPFDLMPPEEARRVAAIFDAIAAERKAFRRLENTNLHRDGRLVVLETNGAPVIDNQGRLLGYRGIDRDITDRKQAENAVRESEQRFRLVANTAPVLIWMSGPDKLCNYFNQPWLEFTGRPLEAELGNGWADGVHPEDLKRCLDTYTQAFDRRESFQMQYRLRRHDGEYRWVVDIGVPRFNPDGSFAGYIGSCIDITARRRIEETLANMGRRLIEAHEEERTWIARELHDDINQRIALLAIELERWNQCLPESAVDVHDHIHHACQRLSDIAKDIQALSHHLHSSKLEYLGIVAAANSFCRELSEQQKVQVEFNHADVPRIIPKEISLCLFRVLQEALQNAVKHSGARHFHVVLRGTSDEICLTVSDPGVGFDWHRAMNLQGLGLISMRERLQLVNGEFSIESESGRGATIYARVPLGTEENRVGVAG